MRYIKGIEREQTILFPESIDDYVGDDNLVRFINAFVDTLDIVKLGLTYSQPKETGRMAYNPSSMLKLYIYGYTQRIRSSRRLESETIRNVEVMWLMEKLTPDFKTIADFRKDNIDSLKKVFREFTLLCKKMNLFGKELAVIDGSKFKAVNSKAKCFTKGFLKSEIKEIDAKIDKHLKEIETIDREERNTRKIDKKKLESSIKEIREKREEVEQMLKRIESGEIEQISKTDKDSRMMKQAGGGYKVSYNGQISVDSKHHLIIDIDVTNEGNDLNQLSNMAKKSKEIMEDENKEENKDNNKKKEEDKFKVVADVGYHKGEEIAKCESADIACYVPSPQRSPNERAGRYGIDDFKYDKDKDLYVCPANEELTFRGTQKRDDNELRKYECSKCKQCTQRDKCISSKGNKVIKRSQYQEALQTVRQRCKENRDIVKRRGQIVEHVFGTMKEAIGYGGGFLLKGLEKVSGEFSLIALSYNIKRVQSVLGVITMIEILKQLQ
ncbi:MAG: IS1182 family transposase [Ignavibacteriae bacterium]|nr:IS1182 family transposase [Ignavibacteriota bacterium]